MSLVCGALRVVVLALAALAQADLLASDAEGSSGSRSGTQSAADRGGGADGAVEGETGTSAARLLQQVARPFRTGHITPPGRRLKNAGFRYRHSQCPDSWDWRTQNAISPVQDQGDCGSCWAFAAAGAMEAAHAIDTGTSPEPLSEQALVNCVTTYCDGCQGGWYVSPWLYTIAQRGIPSAAQDPYTAKQGTCSAPFSNTPPLPIRGFDDVPANETALLQAACNTPVAVAIDASQDFTNYQGGIFTGSCSSDPSAANHAMLLVGYGRDATSGQRYWIVKNQWGTGWGEGGYIRMVMGINLCGIANFGAYTYFSDPTPSSLVTAQCASSYTVSLPNQTIIDVAAAVGQDAQDLMTANPGVLTQEQQLQVGAVLNMPPCNFTRATLGPCSIHYVVQANDTLSSLANQFNVQRGDIIASNLGVLANMTNITMPVGSSLVIPGQPCPPPGPAPSTASRHVTTHVRALLAAPMLAWLLLSCL